MVKLRNKFELKTYNFLKKKKVKFKYEGERIPYILYCDYINDFPIETPLGKIYIETKGYLRPEDKRKLVAVKKQHPEKDIRILFYRRNLKYIKWADRNGFKWAIGVIPQEWINGL